MRGLRICTNKATSYSPYLLVFKQVPTLSIPSAFGPFTEQDLEDLEAPDAEELCEAFKLITEEVV